jgi:valyl-tRNA synthetase
MIKVEPHENNMWSLLPLRNTVVEPYYSKQWFVRMKPLAEKAMEGGGGWVKANFSPKCGGVSLKEWMNNIQDWCISRQIWWGHRIPDL